jgi:hypothetical protein
MTPLHLVLATTLLFPTTSSAQEPAPRPIPVVNATGVDDTVDVSAKWRDGRFHRPEPKQRPLKGPPLVESRVIDPAMCQPGSSVTYDPAYSYRCDGFDLECAEGEILQPPRETRSRPTGTAEWGPWTALSSWQCATPQEGDLIDDVRTAFAEMTLTPPPVTVIDGRGWTFVQIDTIVYSDDEPQTLATTVGGTPVELRATPVEWRWDFGDNTKPLTTTKPGGPYPDKTVTHVYTRLGTYTVTLTTTWQGQWRLVGETQWRDVDGQNTTTSTSEPFTTHEIRTRLVTPPG